MSEQAGNERETLAKVLMESVLVPGPVRVTKGEGIVLTSSEAMRAVGAILASDWLAARDRRIRAEALREAAVKWRPFIADQRCPTCQMGSRRETVGMVCQTCGTDYGSAS